VASKPKAPAPLAIAYRAPADLKADPRNARTHSPEQIAQLRASIREFGFTNPVLLRPDGMIGAGHGRVEAAKAEGLAEIPTVTITGLTDDQWRAYVLADNRLALNAGWDVDLLAAELRALEGGTSDLTLTGFSQTELDDLLRQTASPAQAPEAFPEFDEAIETEHKCPKCGYAWSGKAS
jgi:ParB-like chromosome segregation protein Spo0J